ncbi:MAG: tRNA (adenosine(37)-N6)-threonylcarbamoyltransferase complex dimerization subunit type 1 TsaB [Clostridia bacterium]
MKILAIDTSSDICSVSILEDEKVILKKDAIDSRTHSQKLMPMIDDIFKQTHLSLNDIQLLACCIGPGSFTGVRIGVSTIKAFADSTHLPIVGISSLEGLAQNVRNSYFKEESDYVCSVIDAKNDNVYYGLFKKQEDATYQIVGNFDAKNIHTMIEILELIPESIIFVGDGAVKHKYTILEKLKKSVFVVDAFNRPTSVSIGQCAFYQYKQGHFGNSNSLSPLYLRKSQAERALEGEK